MNQRNLLNVALEVLIGYLVFELYMALRPANLTEQISEWMETNRGRFASFYAERQRRTYPDPPRDDE